MDNHILPKKPWNRVSIASFILSATALSIVALAVAFDLPGFILVLVPVAAVLGLVLGVISAFTAGFARERGPLLSVLAILLALFLFWRALYPGG